MPIVCITGCSSGFGLLTALECARRGDTVFATMRSPDRGDDLRSRAKADDLAIEILPLDVTDDRSVRHAVTTIAETAGGLDALVNNAGIGQFGPVEEFSDDEVAAMFDTNVFGALRMARASLPHLRRAGGGVIVNVTSLGGIVAPPFMAVYSSTKFALEGLTEGLAGEVAPYGVRVISIAPGAYATPMADKVGDVGGHTEDSPYRSEAQTVRDAHLAAMDQQGNPEEVAVAIADAIHDPAYPVRKVLPEALAFIEASRGATPAEQVRSMLRQNYGLS